MTDNTNIHTHDDDSTYWLNLDKIHDGTCLHVIAVGNQERSFKGVELIPATPATKAAKQLQAVLILVHSLLDVYEAPPTIITKVSEALQAAANPEA